jgi:hypothetical protein
VSTLVAVRYRDDPDATVSVVKLLMRTRAPPASVAAALGVCASSRKVGRVRPAREETLSTALAYEEQ